MLDHYRRLEDMRLLYERESMRGQQAAITQSIEDARAARGAVFQNIAIASDETLADEVRREAAVKLAELEPKLPFEDRLRATNITPEIGRLYGKNGLSGVSERQLYTFCYQSGISVASDFYLILKIRRLVANLREARHD